MGASIKGKGKRGGFVDINVTPLVDVMLVLLVVFMVTAPMLTTGLDIELPKVEAAAKPVSDTRLIATITKEGRVYLGKKEITGRVRDALAASERLNKEKVLFVRADKDARYGEIAHVVAVSRDLGISGLNLLVEPTSLPENLPEADALEDAGADVKGN